ncbi:MAG TPA: hypothetical protein VIC85_21535 [Ktedonobacterales bacterium]|jgi:hypothetical protein
MGLDEELNELLAGLGVVLEEARPANAEDAAAAEEAGDGLELECELDVTEDHTLGDESAHPSELSLFQTSREHYGVFYRLDLVEGAPQLRVFVPDDESSVRMRCYLVRAAGTSPLRAWFASARGHDGSDAYEEARDVAQQHLLFAAGEVMKRLFWGAMPSGDGFPAEVNVCRLV